MSSLTNQLHVDLDVQDNFQHVSTDHVGDVQPASNRDRETDITLETWQSWFQQWLTLLNPTLSPSQSYEISLLLTTDAEIQALNAQYRNQDKPTDVLAFAALEVDYPVVEEMGDFPLYLGDIVISVETAIQQANQQQHSLRRELAWLASHGLLHLLGWDHPDDLSLDRMLNQQDLLLASVSIDQ